MDTQTKDKLQEIEDAWMHDINHPFEVYPILNGTALQANFIDGNSDVRDYEEALKNPFRVAMPKSDIKDIGFLLQLLRDQETQLAKYERVVEVLKQMKHDADNSGSSVASYWVVDTCSEILEALEADE